MQPPASESHSLEPTRLYFAWIHITLCWQPFSFLKLVNLSDNNLYGDIPLEVSHLFRLQDLPLSNNSLTGRIPGNLTNCPELSVTDFTRNKLSGNIPVELGSLKKIVMLQIGGNNLTGTFFRKYFFTPVTLLSTQ